MFVIPILKMRRCIVRLVIAHLCTSRVHVPHSSSPALPGRILRIGISHWNRSFWASWTIISVVVGLLFSAFSARAEEPFTYIFMIAADADHTGPDANNEEVQLHFRDQSRAFFEKVVFAAENDHYNRYLIFFDPLGSSFRTRVEWRAYEKGALVGQLREREIDSADLNVYKRIAGALDRYFPDPSYHQDTKKMFFYYGHSITQAATQNYDHSNPDTAFSAATFLEGLSYMGRIDVLFAMSCYAYNMNFLAQLPERVQYAALGVGKLPNSMGDFNGILVDAAAHRNEQNAQNIVSQLQAGRTNFHMQVALNPQYQKRSLQSNGMGKSYAIFKKYAEQLRGIGDLTETFGAEHVQKITASEWWIDANTAQAILERSGASAAEVETVGNNLALYDGLGVVVSTNENE